MIKVAGFDLTEAMEMVGDESLIVELLQIFRDDLQVTEAELKRYVAAQDWVAAERSVHKLKSSAGTLGATQLYQWAQTLDNGLKRGALDTLAYGQFMTALTAARQSLRAL